MSPILKQDALDRLQRAQVIRRFEYTLNAPQAVEDALTAGGAVDGALDVLREVRGINIQVAITMGHAEGTLALGAVKRAFRKLSQFGNVVGKLRVMGAEDEHHAPIPIDFINDRLHSAITVADDGRELDREDCCRQLRQVFENFRPEIERQLAPENDQ
jgi:DNA-binding Lrp family transcriptional regulator